MTTRNSTGLLLAGALLVPALSAQEVRTTRDPIRDYLNHFETQPGEQLITSQVDLNADGIDEVFLSRTSLYNGRQGNIWVLYESLPDGSWQRHDELSSETGGAIVFHRKAVSVQPDGNGRKKLVRYSPGSSRSGYLTSFRLGSDGVAERTEAGGREIYPGAGDAALFERYFEDGGSGLEFHLQSMANLHAEYLPFNGWFHQITAGKLVFLLLCVLVPLWLLRQLFRLFFRGGKRRSAS